MWALPNKVIFCRSLMLIATSMSLQVLFLWYLIITSGLLAAISLSLCIFISQSYYPDDGDDDGDDDDDDDDDYYSYYSY